MVVLIRDLANKYSFTSAFNPIPSQIARTPAHKAMDINNFDDIRERLTSSSKKSFKSPSISSTTSSIPYHEKIEINNNLPDKEFTEPVNSSRLSYKDNSREGIPVSEATDISSTKNQQYVSNKALALKSMSKP